MAAPARKEVVLAEKPIGSAALEHARPDRFVKTVQLEHQNARSHGNRPTRR